MALAPCQQRGEGTIGSGGGGGGCCSTGAGMVASLHAGPGTHCSAGLPAISFFPRPGGGGTECVLIPPSVPREEVSMARHIVYVCVGGGQENPSNIFAMLI